MSKLIETKRKCVFCGCEQSYTEVQSTSFNGHMDLDTRPPEMKRFTLAYEVQMCEKCSYSNFKIDQLITGIKKDDLLAKNYQAIVSDNGISKTAKAFLLAAYLNKMQKNFRKSGVLYLSAAWVFDDEEKTEEAKRARSKSIESLEKYLEQTGDLHFGVTLVDLYRRVGNFAEANTAIEHLLTQTNDSLLTKILLLEKKLVLNKDIGCHTTEEARK